MACKHLPNCNFLEKISSVMPHTTKMVKQTYCVDKKRCVLHKMAKTICIDLPANEILPVKRVALQEVSGENGEK
jgi:DNA-binding transcriptional regulator PaaX